MDKFIVGYLDMSVEESVEELHCSKLSTIIEIAFNLEIKL